MERPWYVVDNVEQLSSPALLVYLEQVRENLRRMIALAGSPARLRPHVKTHKMGEVIALQVQAGLTKFKVATFPEAEMVAQRGGADVILAYPLVGPNAARFARLIAAYPRTTFSTLVDDPQALSRLAAALVSAGQTADVLVEIDNGMHRTGIAPGPAALALYQQLAHTPGVRTGGLHVYDGHIRDRDLQERISHAEADFVPVQALIAQIRAAGLPIPRLVCGGTPTFPVHARVAERECSPGTCVFWDVSYASKFPDLNFVNGALVLTRVVSKPGTGRLCLDLGYKAISPDNPDPRVQLLDLPDAKMVVHSEEHLVVETARADEFAVGQPLYGIPWHVCPTCALYSEAVVVENGHAHTRWKVQARDRLLTV